MNVEQHGAVFIVDDEPDVARLLAEHVRRLGYGTRIFEDSASALREAEADPPALFLLDIGLKGEDGLQLCERLRRLPAVAATPIIFVTSRASEDDRVLGLEAGADDYITKPFSPKELGARVKAVLRRYQSPGSGEVLGIGELLIDPRAMKVLIGGRDVLLTVTEYRVLEHLAKQPGRVMSREQLLAAVWRGSSHVSARAVDVYVRRIRGKIERDPENPEYLLTVRGAGYRLANP
jgi:two-component system phosphate regulon response regulator PhoB